jgi:hypothetical protein
MYNLRGATLDGRAYVRNTPQGPYILNLLRKRTDRLAFTHTPASVLEGSAPRTTSAGAGVSHSHPGVQFSICFCFYRLYANGLGVQAGGIQVFQIHGALFHRTGPLEELEGQMPTYAQLYFHDPQYAARTRLERNPQLQLKTLLRLNEMLHLVKNPYINIYMMAKDRSRHAGSDTQVVLTTGLTLALETGVDRRRENVPTCDEVSLVIPDIAAAETSRPIVLAARNNPRSLFYINAVHPAYLPLHYVLMFPHGDKGWHPNIQLRFIAKADGTERVRDTVSQQSWFRYHLFCRPGNTTIPFAYFRLFQQYLVDAHAVCDQARLYWIKQNQKTLRADLYQGVADAVTSDDGSEVRLGRRIVLPSSYLGGSRFISRCYQDSMAIVRRLGRPTLFITFTATSWWPEVERELGQGDSGVNRADLICRVFYLKMKQLLKELYDGKFGEHLGHVFTIEYQKRGLPHIHLLLFLPAVTRDNFTEPDHIDRNISAEIPSVEEDPNGVLTALVKKFMIHGPCGEYNPYAPCMVLQPGGALPVCSKRFPKPYCAATTVQGDGYPEYRRRRNHRTITVKCRGVDVKVDNSWVVPYNPQLLRKYAAHINIEICGTIHAIKYIHKYIYKGTDRAVLTVSDGDTDEVQQHLTGRYLSPSEAVWRIMKNPVHDEYPAVEQLAVHLEHQQTVYFQEDATVAHVLARLDKSGTTLTAFFEYNARFPTGRHLLYQDFPDSFTWVQASKEWKVRKQGKCIGRMYFCSPVQGERYYLRLLLTSVRGPTSFTDLKTYLGRVYPTFQACAAARGLLLHDGDWVKCFEEAVFFQTGRALRSFFVSALLTGEVTDPAAIWSTFGSDLCNDLAGPAASLGVSSEPEAHLDYGLYLLEGLLAESGKHLTDLNLPVNRFNWGVRVGNQLIASELQYNREDLEVAFLDYHEGLNRDQLAVFDTVVDRIRDASHTAHFFVQGPAGTGKTYLWKALCAYYRSEGKIVLCVASSGIAAVLLPGGRTAHSRFRIPIDIYDTSVAAVKPDSELGELLRQAVLIIWDEVPMQHRYCFEAVDRMLQDVRDSTDTFGGLPLVCSGDFAQILPVVRHGDWGATVDACLQRSPLWRYMTVLHLRQNMRVLSGEDNQRFAAWTRTLATPQTDGSVPVPSWVKTFYQEAAFLNHVYPPDLVTAAATDPSTLSGCAILAVRNDNVSATNRALLEVFPGDAKELLSYDSAEIEDATAQDVPPPEVLQSFEPPSLPPSKLCLKVGAPIMLLRNLYPSQGLCNGTRLTVTRISRRILEARILDGEFRGQLRLLPRIKLTSTDGELPFIVTRTQFPVRLSFAITVNKSQGQSLAVVGVDLRHAVFTHGQLYVALSRVTTLDGLCLLLPEPPEGESGRTVRNIVFSEVLLT